jgi:transcriptional regulator with GAF, ATPase, and Fis domain
MTLVDRDAEVAEAFADIARRLQRVGSREDTWQEIVDLAGGLLPEFEHAAISLVRRDGRIDTPASSDDVGRAVDKIQYDTEEGPCLSAIRDQDVYLTGDLSKEDRWPTFSERAVRETGIHSMLSLRLFVDADCLGALNLYSKSSDAFDQRAQSYGKVLAAHAAVAMSAADEHELASQLTSALESNRDIGVAVGIMMIQSKTDRVGAFALLSEASQRMNVKLRDLAARIVAGAEQSRGGT